MCPNSSTGVRTHPFFIALKTKKSHRAPNANGAGGERNPIGRRTQSDRTADGIRSDGERNPIGRRTETDRTADATQRKEDAPKHETFGTSSSLCYILADCATTCHDYFSK